MVSNMKTLDSAQGVQSESYFFNTFAIFFNAFAILWIILKETKYLHILYTNLIILYFFVFNI